MEACRKKKMVVSKGVEEMEVGRQARGRKSWKKRGSTNGKG